MQKTVHRILTALTAVLVVTGLALALSPTAASAGAAMIPSRTCFGQGTPWYASVYADGDVYATQWLTVTVGSPCQDINLRGVTANGVNVCRSVRIHWGSGAITWWVWYCGGNAVLASFAVEGRQYRVETYRAQGPAMVAIRD